MLDFLRIMLAPHLPNREERGASAVEYGLLVAGIAAVIIIAVFVLGDYVGGAFDDTNSEMQNGGVTSRT